MNKRQARELAKFQFSQSSTFSVPTTHTRDDAHNLRNGSFYRLHPNSETMATYSQDEVDEHITRAMREAVQEAMRDSRANNSNQNSPQEDQANGIGHIQAFTEALKNIKLTAFSSTLKIPKFDPKKMSAVAFLQEVERYFMAQGHQEGQYLYLVKTILPTESQAWLDHTLPTVPDWDSFKDEFINRYDSWLDAGERMRLLHTRRQTSNESVEFFIYDMLRQGKLVSPNETTAEATLRAKQGLFPRLRTALGPTNYSTPAELFEACRIVHANLKAEDKFNKIIGKLPPLVTTDEDKSEGQTSSNTQPQNQTQGYQSRQEFQLPR